LLRHRGRRSVTVRPQAAELGVAPRQVGRLGHPRSINTLRVGWGGLNARSRSNRNPRCLRWLSRAARDEACAVSSCRGRISSGRRVVRARGPVTRQEPAHSGHPNARAAPPSADPDPPITLINADQVHRRTLGLYREIALNGELEALESLPLLKDARGRPVHRPAFSDLETRAERRDSRVVDARRRAWLAQTNDSSAGVRLEIADTRPAPVTATTPRCDLVARFRSARDAGHVCWSTGWRTVERGWSTRWGDSTPSPLCTFR
jgi:hypothetical protein